MAVDPAAYKSAHLKLLFIIFFPSLSLKKESFLPGCKSGCTGGDEPFHLPFHLHYLSLFLDCTSRAGFIARFAGNRIYL